MARGVRGWVAAWLGILPLLLASCASGPLARRPPAPPLYPNRKLPPVDIFAASQLAAPDAPDVNYMIGISDRLQVEILDFLSIGDMAEMTLDVGQDGILDVPHLGDIPVEGRTAAQVQDDICARLIDEGILFDPVVLVNVVEYRSRAILLMGNVRRPGFYYLRRNTTNLLGALALGGGLSEGAGTLVEIRRPARRVPGDSSEAEVFHADLLALIQDGSMLENAEVLPNDVLYVAEADNYYLSGFVSSPGARPIRKPITVLEAVATAGGFRYWEASATQAFIRRVDETGSLEIIEVDLFAMIEGTQADIWLQPNDHVEIPQSTARFLGWELWNLLKGRFVNLGFNAAAGGL